MTEFTQTHFKVHITKKIELEGPFLGVDAYLQNEIPALSLQEGLEALQSCMAKKRIHLPDEISRIVIYKTLKSSLHPVQPDSSRIVYDYVFKEPFGHLCQEFVYSPASASCYEGLRVNCQINILDLQNQNY